MEALHWQTGARWARLNNGSVHSEGPKEEVTVVTKMKSQLEVVGPPGEAQDSARRTAPRVRAT